MLAHLKDPCSRNLKIIVILMTMVMVMMMMPTRKVMVMVMFNDDGDKTSHCMEAKNRRGGEEEGTGP